MLGGRAPLGAAVLGPASLPEGGKAAVGAPPGDCQPSEDRAMRTGQAESRAHPQK